jgi:hypothetical protein
MKKVTVVFSKATSWFAPFSWAIKAAEGTPYSHVAIRVTDDTTGLPLYYQASHTFVNAMCETEFLAEEKVIYSFDFIVADSIDHDIKVFAQSKLGVPYGTIGCIGLAIVQLASWVGIKLHNPFRKLGETYWCSAFIAAMLENADCLKPNEILDDLTPKDLYPLVKSLPPVWNRASNVNT